MQSYDITVETLSLSYCQKKIFDNFSLEVPAGQTSAILGTSGVGKSTLLHSIAGLNSGCTAINKKIKPTSSNALISYMAQDAALLPWLNVLDNILISKKLSRQPLSQLDRDNAVKLLHQTQLQDVQRHYPAQLSGGMYQRVALARTLFEDKPIVLMDEPFSSLDAITRLELQDLANELLMDKTVLLVTHDPLEALRMADNIYMLSGTPASLSEPLHIENKRPREINDPSLIAKQAFLLNQLRGHHD